MENEDDRARVVSANGIHGRVFLDFSTGEAWREGHGGAVLEEDVSDAVLARIRQNNPDQTDVVVASRFVTGNKLSKALQSNTFVKEITLDLRGLLLVNDTVKWDSLLRVLATRENLERAYLCDEWVPDEERIRITAPHPQVTPFLLAIQQNPRIHTVTLRSLQLSGDSVAAFLDSATSLTTLEMYGCGMAAPADTLAIAAALQRNKNIQRLELRHLHTLYLIPILSSLVHNATVRELVLTDVDESHYLSLAVADLLETTKTIQRLQLEPSHQRDQVDVDNFRAFAQGLIKSKSVTGVKFTGFKFDSQEVALILNSILECKSNLQSLNLDDSFVPADGRPGFSAAILNLLQPHSSLRSLELFRFLSRYGLEWSYQFNRLMAAVETSPLERLSIGPVARGNCQTLIASIPKMQIGTLELTFGQSGREMKGDLIQAIKQNASLRTVVAKLYNSEDWLDNEDKRKLSTYLLRNKLLAEWIENPNVVPKAAWAQGLNAAQRTGPDTVFRTLRALAPSLELFEAEQCRKRRRPDSPS